MTPDRASGGRPRLDLPEREWLITGSGRGLGADLARRVEGEIGARVTGVDRSAPEPGAMSAHLEADLTTPEGVALVVDHIHTARPDVLVNCAATNQSRDVAETDDALLDEILEVGFRTPFVLMREMAQMANAAGRHVWVVNIVSPYRLVGVRTHSLYCGTKAALSRAGESLATERTGRSVQVVSVSPGAFNSGFRPVDEGRDAWLVRTYRNRGARTPEQVGGELLRRLRRSSRRRHRTIRLGWDGLAFEVAARALSSDLFVDGLNRVIGQREESSDEVGPGQVAH